MTRRQETTILRLWSQWCRIWPTQYGHDSLQAPAEGYDPVFDVIPSQAYKDFFYEIALNHEQLKTLNAFEVIDVALNQTRAPESSGLKPSNTGTSKARVARVELEVELEVEQKGERSEASTTRGQRNTDVA